MSVSEATNRYADPAAILVLLVYHLVHKHYGYELDTETLTYLGILAASGRAFFERRLAKRRGY